MALRLRKFASITVDVDTLSADMSVPQHLLEYDVAIRKIAYSKSVPRFLSIFQDFGLKATFFVVGKDGLIPENRRMIREIHQAGHEIANHSFSHQRDLVSFKDDAFLKDVEDSGKILSDITGKKISGFRMPGSTINIQSLNLLEKLGYKYDSSLNSSLNYNFIKWFYREFLNKNRFSVPCQSFRSLFLSNEPYFPDKNSIYKESSDNSGILEIPLTVIPFFQLPFMSYILLASGSFFARLFYELVNLDRKFINLVAHDHELALWEDHKDCGLNFNMCGYHMKNPVAQRQRQMKDLIGLIRKDHDFLTLEKYTDLIKTRFIAKEGE